MLKNFLISVMLLLVPEISEAHDLEVKALKFYAVIGEDGYVVNSQNRVIAVKKGERIEFSEYAPHSGLAPDIIDVVLTVANTGHTDQTGIETRISISAKVGKVVLHQKTPDLPIHEATEASAEWFAPIILLKQTIKRVPHDALIEVSFQNINLGALLKSYSRRHLWPVMLNFQASVEPVSTEDSFKNNTLTRALRIGMWE